MALQYNPNSYQPRHLPNYRPYLAPKFPLFLIKFRPRIISVEDTESALPVNEERLNGIHALGEDRAGEMPNIARVVEMEDIFSVQHLNSL
jgi:hypothetical protein